MPALLVSALRGFAARRTLKACTSFGESDMLTGAQQRKLCMRLLAVHWCGSMQTGAPQISNTPHAHLDGLNLCGLKQEKSDAGHHNQEVDLVLVGKV